MTTFPDALVESNETFTISLKTADGYTIAAGGGSATFTIFDERPVERASVDSAGAQAAGGSTAWLQSLSGDGRFVVFASEAATLAPGDTNGTSDVFLRDLQTGTTTSLTAGGNGYSGAGAVSADGRFVAFQSAASNMVSGDANGATDVFLLDRQTGTTTNLTAGGNGASSLPTVSADGRYIAFYSEASNLVAGDTNGALDVFVRDTQTGTTTRVSAGGANQGSFFPTISADGHTVTFLSQANDLDPLRSGTPGAYAYTYIADLAGHTTTLLAEAGGSIAYLSGDGRFAAYTRATSHTNPDGTSYATYDAYVLDRLTGIHAYLAPGGADAISADGRFVLVENGNRLSVVDWVAGTTTLATPGTNYETALGRGLSDDGRTVAFLTATPTLVPGDTNSAPDMFVTHLGAALPLVSLAAGIASVQEGGALSFVLTRTGDTSTPLTVTLSAAGAGANPATPGADVTVPLSAVIPAGQTSVTVTVPTLSDSLVEGSEGLVLTLQGASAYLVAPGAGSAAFTILDAPVTPTVSLAAATTTTIEGGTLAYTVTRTGDLSQALTIQLGVAGSSPNPATSGTDFAAPLTATIGAGQASATVSFATYVDGVVEPTEGFTLRLLTSSKYTLAPGASTAAFAIADGPSTIPSPVLLGLQTGSDTGSSATDGVTRIKTPTISGTAGAGLTVSVFVDGTKVGTATAGATGAWAFKTGNLTDGERAITASAADKAGNTSATSAPVALVIDSVAPAISALAVNVAGTGAAVAANGYATGNALRVGGTGEAGASVQVFDGTTSLGTAIVDGAGIWGFDATSLVEGLHRFSAKASDLAGNATTTAVFSVTVDTIAPDVPTGLGLQAGSDTGASLTDGVTKLKTPTVAGTAVAGSVVHVVVDGAEVGRATAGTTGAWAYKLTLTEGDHAVTAFATDAAGNASAASAPLALTIDATAPALALLAAETGQTGVAVTSNGYSSDDVLHFAGTGEAGGRIEVFDGTALVGTTTVGTGGSWGLDLDSLSEGLHRLSTRATDVAGNVTTAALFTVTVDTIAPDVPVLLGLQVGSDTGSSAMDGVTRIKTPTISGTAGAGLTVSVFVDGTKVGTTTAGATGAWAFKTGNLTDGEHAITAVAADRAGNASATSSPLALVIDSVAPALSALAVSLAETGAAVAANGYATGNALRVGGTGEAGASVQVLDGTTGLGTAIVDAAGAWGLDVTGLAEGLHRFSAKASDLAGNATPTATFGVTVDTVAPDAPTGLSLQAGSDTGASVSDGVTKLKTPTIAGMAAAGALVRVVVDGTEVGAATAGASGAWTFKATLTEGTHAVTAFATDKAGNASAISTPLNLTVDATAPNQPVIDALSSVHGVTAAGFTSDQAVTLSGHTEGNASVQVYDGTKLIQTVTADGSGVWNAEATGLTEGRHSFTAKATDLAGNLGAASAGTAVTVDTTAPAPTLTKAVYGATTLTLSGASEAGSEVSVYSDGVALGKALTGATGAWSFEFAKPSDAVHVLRVEAVDRAGNFGAGANGMVLGSTGGDTITGSSGKDVILAGSGADRIDGGAGLDTLTGGAGNDAFVFRLGQANGDVVTDFAGAGSAVGDRLEFQGFGSGAYLERVGTGDTYLIHADAAHGSTTETIRLVGVTNLDVLTGGAHNDVLFA